MINIFNSSLPFKKNTIGFKLFLKTIYITISYEYVKNRSEMINNGQKTKVFTI